MLKIDNQGEMPIRRGDFLLAEPLLKEDFFSRAVVLILDFDANNGIMGLTLNKLTSLTLADIIKGWEQGQRIPIYCGGPVDTERLFMLHSLGDKFSGSVEICPGIFVGGKLDDIVNYINEGGVIEGKMRFFLGYSGWGSGQLQDELENDTWALVHRADDSLEDILRGQDNAFWRREVERLGPRYRSWLIVPQNPEEN
ncbi:MAG: YqgE/AlgH family protein [Muribaculaceae bacterium]|nr:YqgE/AlgH family protein [Muribaculaceae bacterium]